MTDIAQQGFTAVLRNRAFCALWAGQVFSQVADKIFFILLVTLVSNRTHANTVMSAALVAYTIPNVFFGGLAGVFVDRWDTRRTMILTNVARGGLILSTTWIGNHLWILITLAFLISTASQPFTPAESATIPLVVTREQLLTANSLFATTVMASIIVGFTLGEPFITLAGPTWSPAAVAALYAISTASLALVRYTKPWEPHPEHTLGAIVEDMKEGLRALRALTAVRVAIGRLMLLFAMFAALSLLAILFAKTQLHTNFTWILATAGVGLASGAGVIGRFGHGWPKDTVTTAGFALSGVALGLLGTAGAQSVPAAFGLAALIGFSSAFVVIPMQTVLQETIPEAVRGKVFGVQNMAQNIATTLPMAFTGPLADLVGARTVFLGLGGALLATAGAIRWYAPARLPALPPSTAVPVDLPPFEETTP